MRERRTRTPKRPGAYALVAAAAFGLAAAAVWMLWRAGG